MTKIINTWYKLQCTYKKNSFGGICNVKKEEKKLLSPHRLDNINKNEDSRAEICESDILWCNRIVYQLINLKMYTCVYQFSTSYTFSLVYATRSLTYIPVCARSQNKKKNINAMHTMFCRIHRDLNESFN